MCRFKPQLWPAIFCLLCLPAISQENNGVLRIGVALPSSGVNAVPDDAVRDRLVEGINQHKADKKLKMTLEAVPLHAPPGGRAVAEATKKKCDFVLYTRVKAIEISSQYQPSYSDSTIGTRPVVTAKVEYLLRRLSDGASYASGAGKSDEMVSDRDALLQAVDRVSSGLLAEMRKGGNEAHSHKGEASTLEKIAPRALTDVSTSGRFCDWLPGAITHAEALRGVCEYAMSLPQKMPNFICQQETWRFQGHNRVPFDLITATVRYEDGDESYSDLKVNGKPAVESAARAAGLWSSGQFEGNLRAIFHADNQAEFDYFGEDETGGRKAWVFTFEIERQNEPLWQLRGKDEVIAPAYGGEIWVDEQTGGVLRFRSAARDLPAAFPMRSAEIVTDYGDVPFGDGTSFVLPVSSSVATRYERMEPTRNVVQFRSCHKFRATPRILTGMPGEGTETETAAKFGNEALRTEFEQNEKVYEIFRDQAIREDEAALAREQQEDTNVATVGAFWRLAALEKQRQRNEAQLAAQAQAKSAQGGAGNEPLTTIKVNVRLVPVSVVTRDESGRAVGNLVKDNFRLFDEKKPQVITRFTVEKNEGRAASEAAGNAGSSAAPEAPARERKAVAESNNVAYVFDDLHTNQEDLANAGRAAGKHLAELQGQDRAAVFTTSGQVSVDFTADQEKLMAALKGLRAHSANGWDCPPMNYYMADRIVNQEDAAASGVAVTDAMKCGHGTVQMAERLAASRALEVALAGRVDSEKALRVVHDVIGRMAAMPGRRTIVLVSPGFLTAAENTQNRAMALVERAVDANIVVNTLDVSGLTTPIDAGGHFADMPERGQLAAADTQARNTMMADLAYGTGGTFFHNNNNLDEGFRRTADTPEYIYVLGFAPQKLDGRFHRLKVALNPQQKLTVQARPGYYATKAEAQ